MNTAKIGEHCFIMEENVIQDYVSIGNNNILWSGNHIGHHTHIGDHNFISSHVVISGSCTIGNNNFFGVNSCLGDEVSVGDFNWFSPLTSSVKDVEDENLFVMPKTEVSKVSTKRYFKVQ
jgi:UDP-3-O-[3-hydroxymyristoyl] glucosamine N-acyltransferase